MATFPRAVTHLEPTASFPGGGDNLICLLSPCATSDDITPRFFGSAQALYEQHGYCEGVEYAALHTSKTGLPVLFIGMPIGTAGSVSRYTSHGNSGSSVVTAAAGSDGVLGEHDGVVRVLVGGTIGTDQIKLELSLDGGRSFKNVRLGTASSYVIPYVNVTLSFAAGTLVAGDTIAEWHGSAPKVDTADLTAARSALAAGLTFFRSMLLTGDLPNDTAASAFNTELEAYTTENERFIYGRASVYDRNPQASLSHSYARLTGSPALTFAEVGGTGDTITRSAGSYLTDGFRDGDYITVTGAVASAGVNNVSGAVATVAGSVLTMGSTDLAAEVLSSGGLIVGSPALTFSASGHTITRSRGSYLADGFRVGDSVTVTGTASNNVTKTITALTATVMTFAAGLADETLGSASVTIVSGQSKAAWMAEIDAEFAPVDGAPRIDLSAGRGAVASPFSGWFFRRPAGWFASLREYQHDLHVATFRKDLGPVGADLYDGNDVLVEWDDRVDGGAGSEANFTTLRSWSNGPRGAFITQSLTRAGDGQITQPTHNMAVINAGCTAVQLATENVVGRTLQLNSDGTATSDALAVIAAEVNAIVELTLLASRGEGPRASSARWTPSPDDIYSVPEPTMHGTLEIELQGTVHSVDTAVRVQSNGQ